jgi:hypothetical protein
MTPPPICCAGPKIYSPRRARIETVASSEVEAWRVDSPTRPCAYCRQDVGADPSTSCPRCDAVYHSDCWASNLARCAIYGCEPAPKPPTPPPVPVLAAPDVTRPAGGWAWLAPLFVILLIGLSRVGSSGPSRRSYPVPPPFPSQVLRHVHQPLEIEALMEAREAVVPASPDDIPCLIEEAQALEDSASALLQVPPGRLTAEVRHMLREGMVADLAALKRAHLLIRRCQTTSADPDLAVSLLRLSEAIRLKRRTLLDLWVAKGPD